MRVRMEFSKLLSCKEMPKNKNKYISVAPKTERGKKGIPKSVIFNKMASCGRVHREYLIMANIPLLA